MKKLIIAILTLLLGGGTAGYIAVDRLGFAGGGNDAYVSSVSHSTTSVSISLRSIYHQYASSSDPTASIWWFSTTTGQGTPWTVLSENTRRVGFECCNRTEATTTLWITRGATTTDMVIGNNSDGYQIYYGGCFSTHDKYGIIYGSKVYGLADTATSTLSCLEFLQ